MKMSLPFAQWPEVDRAAFETAVRKGGLLEPGGPAGHWRETSKQIMIEGYGTWLAWLARTDRLGPVSDPALRCTPDRLTAWLADQKGRGLRAATIASNLRCLKRVLAVMAPDADLSFLAATLRRVDVRQAPLKADRLRPADELLELGCDLMAEAEQSEERLKDRARHYRNGLLIALLALRPLRRSNLAGLTLGRHLVRLETGWRICFPGEEMKNGRPLDEPFPDMLVAGLERYLECYRLALAPRGVTLDPWSGPLWISGRSGGALSGHTINLTVCAITKQRFGKPINLQLFRDSAATTLAVADPEHVRLGAAVNGHADYRTTQRWYNLATIHQAAQSYQEMLASLREETPP